MPVSVFGVRYHLPLSTPQLHSGVLWKLLLPHRLGSGYSLFPFCSLLGEIALLEGLTVVYKSSIDLYFYVIGSSYENEVSLHLFLLSLNPVPSVDSYLFWALHF